MFHNRKFLWIGIAGTLVLVTVLIAGAVVTTTIAGAQSADEPVFGSPGGMMDSGGFGDMMRRGGPGRGMMQRLGDIDQYLADALGITVEQLQAAREEAFDAALDQAVAGGTLTQEQADAVRTLRGSDKARRGFGMGFLRGSGMMGERDDLLADALGISVEKLQAARLTAHNAALDAAVAAGDLTQEQADRMRARHALMGYIDHQALTAGVLGMTVEQFTAAREAGTPMSELMEDAGLTAAEFKTALQAAYEDAVQQAVADGVITQEQADQILAAGGGMGGFGPGGGKHGPRGRFPRSDDRTTPPAAPVPTETGSGTGA